MFEKAGDRFDQMSGKNYLREDFSLAPTSARLKLDGAHAQHDNQDSNSASPRLCVP
jgi:hypothetical protein